MRTSPDSLELFEKRGPGCCYRELPGENDIDLNLCARGGDAGLAENTLEVTDDEIGPFKPVATTKWRGVPNSASRKCRLVAGLAPSMSRAPMTPQLAPVLSSSRAST